MHISRGAVSLAALVLLVLAVTACRPTPTANDVIRDRQNVGLQNAANSVGLPSTPNYREARLLKDIYELRDQTGLVTYSYLWSEVTGQKIFLCDSIGYPIPYATQFTSPETMQTYNIWSGGNNYTGAQLLPQAEPNALFLPPGADGSWVMCKEPNTSNVRPQYVEPKVITLTWKE